MIYWIESMEDGSFVDRAKSYEEALTKQDKLWRGQGIDTYIRKDDRCLG